MTVDLAGFKVVAADVLREAFRAHAKHGTPPPGRLDGTGRTDDVKIANAARANVDATPTDDVTWRQIMYEEVREAFAETDPIALRAELVQVAQVAIAWCQDLDARGC